MMMSKVSSVRSTSILHLALISLAAVSLFVGCKPRTPSPEPTIPPTLAAVEPRQITIPPSAWTTSWIGDAEEVAATVTNDTLTVSLRGKSAGVVKGTSLSAPVDFLQLLPGARVEIQLAAEGDMKLALAVRTDTYYESPAVPLTADSHDLVFDLTASTFKSDRTSWRHEDTVDATAPLSALELVLYPAAGSSARLVITRAQLLNVAPPPTRIVKPIEALDVSASPDPVPLHGRFDIAVQLSTAAMNPFDPDELRLDAIFTSPSGRRLTCPGFVFALASSPGGTDDWRIRFSPDEPGTWTWTLHAQSVTDEWVTDPLQMTCVETANPGPIRVSKADPLYFEHADGTFFYPIGHNVCWNSPEQYRDQFAKMGGSGENWSRVWIAPWNCDIEWSRKAGPYQGLGRYNLANAAKLDGIVDAAEQSGLYLQLVLHEHCRLSAKTNPEWQNNPYNKELGGPLGAPQEFFTNTEARRLARNRLRYIIARWGYSSHVMAWELFNEVDLTDDFRFDTDTAWHREMSEFIKANDPHGHLVTTSYISTPYVDTFGLASIDYAQSHVYIDDIVSEFIRLNQHFATLGKPHFIGEFGRHAADGIDAQDVEGRVLRSGLWTQFMLPSGGNAMSWWWYDHLDPHNLYDRFTALSAFAAGLDRRGMAWTQQVGRLTSNTGAARKLVALIASNTVLAYAYDPAILPWSEPQPPASTASAILTFDAIADGAWTLETWDTLQGRAVTSLTVTAAGGQLAVPFDMAGADVALRLRRADATPAAVTPHLVLDPWALQAGDKPRLAIDIPLRDPPPAIDAVLGDWGGLSSYVVDATYGRTPADNSFRFSVCHDGEHLYVMVMVRDDELVRAQTDIGSLWKDDCVEIWLDTRNDAGYFKGLPHNPGCYQLNIRPALEAGQETDHIVYRHPTLNNQTLPGVKTSSRRTADGYAIEAMIPLTTMRGTPWEAPRKIGFNISVCDADRKNGSETWNHLLWQGKNEWNAGEWSVAKLE